MANAMEKLGDWRQIEPGVGRKLPVVAHLQTCATGRAWIADHPGANATMRRRAAAYAVLRGRTFARILDAGQMGDGCMFIVLSDHGVDELKDEDDPTGASARLRHLVDCINDLAVALSKSCVPDEAEHQSIGTLSTWTSFSFCTDVLQVAAATRAASKCSVDAVRVVLPVRPRRRGETGFATARLLVNQFRPSGDPAHLLRFARDLGAALTSTPTSQESEGGLRRIRFALLRSTGLRLLAQATAAAFFLVLVAFIAKKVEGAQLRRAGDAMSLSVLLPQLHEEYLGIDRRSPTADADLREVQRRVEALEARRGVLTSLRRGSASSNGEQPRYDDATLRKRNDLLIGLAKLEEHLDRDQETKVDQQTGSANMVAATMRDELATFTLAADERFRIFESGDDAWVDASARQALAAWTEAFHPRKGWLRGSGTSSGRSLVRTLNALSAAEVSAGPDRVLWYQSWVAFEAWLAAQGSAWDVVRARMKRQTDMMYAGLNEQSMLPEFTHLTTGGKDLAEPLRFVLLPGGRQVMGLQYSDPTAPNYFENSGEVTWVPKEGTTVHDLAPFWISKLEVSQAQWLEWTGLEPSALQESTWNFDIRADGLGHSLLHPVERASGAEIQSVLRSFRLELPSEAQWEYAARAGSSGPWYSGSDPASLEGRENVYDLYSAEFIKEVFGDSRPGRFNDGFAKHAPVGSFEPSAFGLYDMLGNVRELCLNSGTLIEAPIMDEERGIHATADPPLAVRGGGYNVSPFCGTAFGFHLTTHEDERFSHLGFRPVRTLDR